MYGLWVVLFILQESDSGGTRLEEEQVGSGHTEGLDGSRECGAEDVADWKEYCTEPIAKCGFCTPFETELWRTTAVWISDIAYGGRPPHTEISASSLCLTPVLSTSRPVT